MSSTSTMQSATSWSRQEFAGLDLWESTRLNGSDS